MKEEKVGVKAMFLETLKIAGYKNFREEFTVHFSKGLNVLVGENGVGKSAIVDAIRLILLEDEFGRRGVSEADFHRPFEENATAVDAFSIQVHFGNLSREEMVAFLPWSDLKGNAKIRLDVDNKQNNQGRFRPFLWGGASRASVFERELFDSINCIYLPPLRDAEAKLREGRGSRLARLLRNLNKEGESRKAMEDSVKKFNEELATDDSGAIAKANGVIRKRLKEALGTVFGQDTLIRFSETNCESSNMQWRLFLAQILDQCVETDPLRNLDQIWSVWAKTVREQFEAIVKSCSKIELPFQNNRSFSLSSLRGEASQSVISTLETVEKNNVSNILVTTFHQVKGQTFDAILVVSAPDKRSEGGHWSQWLDAENSDGEHARFAYVASSRPRVLLGWAVPSSSEEEGKQLKKLGFTRIDEAGGFGC